MIRHAQPFAPDWDTPARKALAPQTRVIDGLEMVLHPADNWTEFALWRDGRSPEPQSLAQMVALAQGQRAFIVDIGANCGSYALALAAVMAPGSSLLAFEPNPVMADRLRANLALNAIETVVVHQVALGSATGTATLSLHAENFGESSLLALTGNVGAQITIPLRPLTDFTNLAPRYDCFLLKIDVEGYEPEVLRPFLRDTVFYPDAILIETAHADQWSQALLPDLAALGYQTTFAAEGNALLQRHIR